MKAVKYMKKGVFLGLLGLLVSFMPASSAVAQSYNGTTIPPNSDGVTYNVVAGAGDTVTLIEIGNGDGTITITLTNSVNGSIVVKESSTRPTSASSDAPGKVNLYFDVTLNGMTNDDIGAIVWKFSVSKNFLTQNNVTSANVFLYHFNGSAWERLTTTQVASSSTTVTFEAQVTSFSPFAVTAVEGLSNTGSPYLLGAVIGGGVLIATIGAYMFSRRQQA